MNKIKVETVSLFCDLCVNQVTPRPLVWESISAIAICVCLKNPPYRHVEVKDESPRPSHNLLYSPMNSFHFRKHGEVSVANLLTITITTIHCPDT